MRPLTAREGLYALRSPIKHDGTPKGAGGLLATALLGGNQCRWNRYIGSITISTVPSGFTRMVVLCFIKPSLARAVA